MLRRMEGRSRRSCRAVYKAERRERGGGALFIFCILHCTYATNVRSQLGLEIRVTVNG